MDEEIYGTDFDSKGRVASNGDLLLVTGLDNAKQSIRNYLLTKKGNYDFIDPEYGSDISKVMGEPRNKNTLQLAELILSNDLDQHPMVEDYEINPYFTDKGISAEITCYLVDGSNFTDDLEVISYDG